MLGTRAANRDSIETEKIEVVTLGETMGLLTSTAPGRLQRGSTMTVSSGGSESNVSIGLARLGVRVAWVGRVGADSIGSVITRELRAEGVRVVLPPDPSASTGLMLKERHSPMQTKVWYYRAGSAGSRLERGDVPEDLIRDARLLHVTGITPALSPSAADAARHAISVARAAAVPVAFDVNFRGRLWDPDVASKVLRPLVASVDIMFSGLDEAALFFPDESDPEKMALHLAEIGPSQVVVKMGAQGCLGLADGEVLRRQAVPVDVVDVVGAGDAFVAGYLAELLDGQPLNRRLETAARLGAYACTTAGDWEGLPTREDLMLLESKGDVVR